MRTVLVLVGIYAALFAAGLWLNQQQKAASVTAASGARTVFVPVRPVTAAPESARVPQTPVTASPIPAAPTAPPVSAGPAAPTFAPMPLAPDIPDAPDLPQGWSETVTQQEMPVIEVTNQAESTTLIFMEFQGIPGTFHLECSTPVASMKLPPGEYRYELNGSGYARNGHPDQIGPFTCRKYRKYSIFLSTVWRRDGTEYRGLGD